MTFTYNGLTLSPDYGYSVYKASGLSSIPIRTSEQDNVNRDGGSIYNSLYSMRSINLEGTISGNNQDDYKAKKQSLVEAFSRGVHTLTIVADTGSQYEVEAHVMQQPLIVEQAGYTTFNRFMVTLKAELPYIYGELTTYTLELATITGFEIPTAVPVSLGSGDMGIESIVNDGQPDYHDMYVYGNLENPTITNLTTGKYVQIETTITTGNYVLIRRNNNGVFILHNGTTDYMQYLDGQPFLIENGVNNLRLSASGSGTGYAEVKFRTPHLAI